MSHPRETATIPAGKCGDCGHFAPVGEITRCGRTDCACPRHTAAPGSPYRGHDPQQPPGAEAALAAFSAELEDAQQSLATAIDEEVDAELARDAERDKWLLSEECPHVERNGWTVAERDAWVRSKIRDQERAFRIAKARRQAAQQFVSVLGKQLSAQQSITRSVGDGYRGTRGEGSW